MRIWSITARRWVRQLLGKSADWRDIPVTTRTKSDLPAAYPADRFVIELYMPIAEPKLTKAEWESLIDPFRGRI